MGNPVICIPSNNSYDLDVFVHMPSGMAPADASERIRNVIRSHGSDDQEGFVKALQQAGFELVEFERAVEWDNPGNWQPASEVPAMDTVSFKTDDLVGIYLDWAVAKCEGVFEVAEIDPTTWVYTAHPTHVYDYSIDWGVAGRIIETECIAFDYDEATQIYMASNGVHAAQGKTHLIAAMRCFVASKLGDMVDIPAELASLVPQQDIAPPRLKG